MNNKLKILYLNDIAMDAASVSIVLKQADLSFEMLNVDNRAAYINGLNEYKPDVILSDHSHPTLNSQEALNILKISGLNIPFILIADAISEKSGIKIVKDEVTDCLLESGLQQLPGVIANVTDKIKCEKTPDRVNQHSNFVFDNIDEAFYVVDVPTLILSQISAGCEKIFGYTAAELMAVPSVGYEITHPDDRHKHGEHTLKLRAGEQVVYEYRIIHKDKRIRWMESKIIPKLSAAGDLLQLFGVTRDVTDRKNAAELLERKHIELEQAAERQATILNAMPTSVILLDGNADLKEVNASWKRFLQNNDLNIANGSVGANFLSFVLSMNEIDKTEGLKIAEGIKEVIAGNKPEYIVEYLFTNSLGYKTWFLLKVSPLADENQKGAVILNIDITDRRKAEQSVLKSETNLRSVFENTDASIVLLDSKFNVAAFNKNAVEVIWLTSGKKLKIGSPAFEYCSESRAAKVKEVFKTLNKKERFSYETSYVRKDGSLAWLDVKWVGFEGEQFENNGLIITLNDITAKKNAAIEHERITADLVRKNNDLEQFTIIVSHNLRVPVANIQGLCNLLQDIETDNQEDIKTLSALSTSANQLDEVIIDLNAILDANNQVTERIEEVSLSAIAENVRSGLHSLIEKEGVKLVLNFEEANSFLTLKNHLHSVFYNLIVNSIKYRQPLVQPVIHIQSQLGRNSIILKFTDNGKGIDLKKNSKYLFGLYKRFDYSVEGKGIGLFMVKAQIENMGGRITVKSELNVGTEFILEFPFPEDKVKAIAGKSKI